MADSQPKPKKLNLSLLLDKFFRRTIYLRPLPDRSLQVVDITGSTETYLRDVTGATVIDPSCIVRVRGLKRVDYISLKLPNATGLLNIFDPQKVVVTPPNVIATFPNALIPNDPIIIKSPDRIVPCPHCKESHVVNGETITVSVPDTEVIIPSQSIPVPPIEAEVPGSPSMTEKIFGDTLNYSEMAGRLQGGGNPEADKKMTWILMLAGAAVLVGIFIFFKMQSGGK